MLEVFREEGFRCLSLPEDTAPGLHGGEALDLTLLYLCARSEADLPTFAAEVFSPLPAALEGHLDCADCGAAGIDWRFTFPRRPGDAHLAVLLSLAGMLPTLEELASPKLWLGGLCRLELEADWAGAFEGCGLARARLEEVLADARESRVRLAGDAGSFEGHLFERADLTAAGCVIDVNPLALYALLGLDAQYLLEEGEEAALGAESPWTPGLICLACALGELLPAEDEACDEYAVSRLTRILQGPGKSEAAAGAGALLTSLCGMLNQVDGWQVRSFEEIAGQSDGPMPVNRGERVFRVTRQER